MVRTKTKRGVFDGKQYSLVGHTNSKIDAVKTVKSLRVNGKNARMVKEPKSSKYDWAIYSRKSDWRKKRRKK